MPIDLSKYLGLFASEAQEHLEGLARELVRVEKEHGRESVDAMFRHAHSVKGMAASMGFEQIAVLAHRVEDLVDKLRSRPEALTADTTDVLLAAADHCRRWSRPPAPGSLARRRAAHRPALRAPRRPDWAGPWAHPGGPRGRDGRTPAPAPAAAPSRRPSRRAPRRCRRTDREGEDSPRLPGARRARLPGAQEVAALGNVFAVHPPLEDLKAAASPTACSRWSSRCRARTAPRASSGRSRPWPTWSRSRSPRSSRGPRPRRPSRPSPRPPSRWAPSRRARCGSRPRSSTTSWRPPASSCWRSPTCARWPSSSRRRSAARWRAASTGCAPSSRTCTTR
jgi:HPt (histidine-containing phosphotransfer) domain-containing protein